MKNRVAPEIEEVVVALAVEQPAFSQERVADELRKCGLVASPADVGSSTIGGGIPRSNIRAGSRVLSAVGIALRMMA